MNLSTPFDALDREQVAGVDIRAVSSDRVDLLRGVGTPLESIRTAAVGLAANDHNALLAARPLALDAKEPRSQIEHEVVAAPFSNRSQHGELELGRGENNGLLGNVALLVGSQHEHMFAYRSDGIRVRPAPAAS
jgi:hypothetical protein